MSARPAAPRRPSVTRLPVAGRLAIALVVISLLLTAALWTIGAATRSVTTEEQAFPAAGIDTLRIDGGAGPVTIVVVDRADVVVTTRLTDSALGRIATERNVAGGTLTLTTICGWRCLASAATADQQIALPRATIEAMDLRLTRGAVRVDGFAGDIEVSTGDGDIFLSRFEGEVARLRAPRGLIQVERGDGPLR